jgi:LVIVD repeat
MRAEVRRLLGASVIAAALLMLAGTTVTPVSAHDGATAFDGAIDHAKVTHAHHQHGGETGHLPASSNNVELVSKLAVKNVEPEKIADVGVLNGYAYLAAWGGATCRYNGVHVVDVRNPVVPKEVAFIAAKEGSYPGEGVQALHLDTPKFNGEILVTNNEKCKTTAGFGGLNIYDVSNPEHPTPLAEGVGDKTVAGQGKKNANEIHSVFAWDAGSKAYAVIVDNEEGLDVDIMDITDPKKAFLLAEYDLDQMFPSVTQPGLDEVFHHDMVVKQIGGRQILLASYWDAGYLQLDVTDPTDISLVAESDFTDPDPEAAASGFTVRPEGNAHEAEFTLDNQYVIAADEDFGPYGSTARNLTDATDIHAAPGSDTTPLPPGQTITGATRFVGLACPGDAVPAGDPDAVDIAVVERGICLFTEKVASVVAAGGYDAVLVFNRTGADACGVAPGMTVAGDLPTFGVAPRGEGFAIFDTPYDNAACLAGTGPPQLPVPLGTVGDTITFSSVFNGWGYVHLYDRVTMAELDTYAIPQAHDPAFATDYGDLSVHEVATSAIQPDLAYYSYYAAGFRVTRIVAGQLQEVGHFIDQGGNNFWGAQVFQHNGQEYVAASDRDHGLYIFRYTGP